MTTYVHGALAARAEAERLRNEIALIRECLETGSFTKALVIARAAAPRSAEEVMRAIRAPDFRRGIAR